MKCVIKFTIGSMALLLALGISCQCLLAQPAPIPMHVEPYAVKSGAHEGTGAETVAVFSQTVQVSGVPWLQLHFNDYDLGSKSRILIISILDGAEQTLDAGSLPLWNNSSAYFNGDAVEVTLYAAPGETDVFFTIEEVTVGEWEEGDTIESICGSADNRVASTDPREGRIVPVGCTGWIVSNGAYLTAGHCTGSGMTTLEFNVPASLANGTIQHPPPQDQYPIIAASVVFQNGGIGNDWAVFNCNPNNNGDTAIERQNAFYRMTNDLNPSTSGGNARITGYGLDGPAPNFGSTPPQNADNQTLQTHAGPYVGEVYQGASNSYHNYQADTQGGNSGSPIINEATSPDVTIGIHTNGGCTSTGGSNSGTSFENNALETAIRNFTGTNVRFADVSHPATLEDGTIFRPYNTVAEAVTALPAGGIVSIVAGSYTAAAGNAITITKSMTLVAPVGSVHIGN